MSGLPYLRRSLLFVPGNRPDRFMKAAASGADMICLDLEDAVPAPERDAARASVLAFLATRKTACEVAVRINTLRSKAGLTDVLALASAGADIIAVPKVESAAELEILSACLPGPFLALIESLRGLDRADEIAAAPGVAMVGLGTADLAAEMGVTMDWEPMQLARLLLIKAAKKAGVQAMDGAWVKLADTDGLKAETRRAAALGFTVKPCLHPNQVGAVHEALAPSADDAAHARKIVEAFQAAGGKAVQVDGRMIDVPVANAARRTLAIWERVNGL